MAASDCLFIDSDEATKEQLNFIARVKRFYEEPPEQVNTAESDPNPYEFRINEPVVPYETELTIRRNSSTSTWKRYPRQKAG